MFDLIRNLRYPTFPEGVKFKAERLAGLAMREGFRLFRDERVRELLDFAGQEEEERNRFFNEMVATNVVMLMLVIEQKGREADPGLRRDHLRAVRGELPAYYLGYLGRIGVAGEFVDVWQKLLDLRYDEYAADIPEWRQVLSEQGPKLPGLEIDNTIAIFQALTFGLYRHLRRSRVEKDDPLYNHLQGFQVFVYKKMLKKLR